MPASHAHAAARRLACDAAALRARNALVRAGPPRDCSLLSPPRKRCYGKLPPLNSLPLARGAAFHSCRPRGGGIMVPGAFPSIICFACYFLWPTSNPCPSRASTEAGWVFRAPTILKITRQRPPLPPRPLERGMAAALSSASGAGLRSALARPSYETLVRLALRRPRPPSATLNCAFSLCHAPHCSGGPGPPSSFGTDALARGLAAPRKGACAPVRPRPAAGAARYLCPCVA